MDRAGVDFQKRELFDSAVSFGGEAIRMMGADEQQIEDVIEGVRARDQSSNGPVPLPARENSRPGLDYRPEPRSCSVG